MTTPMLPGRGAPGSHFWGYAPVSGVTPSYPTTHGILLKSTSISLRWAQITNATSYTIQVSTTPDFSGTLLINTTSNNDHGHDFTDAGTNNTKRWWRWKANGSGSAYDLWSEAGSYWINTSFAETVNCPQNYWMLVNPSDVTDRYTLPAFPMYTIAQKNLFRTRDRNRLGTLLSEFITLKATIMFRFDSSLYLPFDMFRELRRYNEELKTFFLITFKDGAENVPAPHVWKVQFETDPELTMISGRQDLLTGSFNFEEV